MKQPKFRGFNKEDNHWYYGHGWFEGDYTEEYLSERGINQQAILYTEGSPVECELDSMGQFTGLKDKNGKEIYEGHIVRTMHHIIKTGEKIYNDVIIHDIRQLEELYYSDEQEIIGNIYENKDLLNA